MREDRRKAFGQLPLVCPRLDARQFNSGDEIGGQEALGNDQKCDASVVYLTADLGLDFVAGP